MVKDNKFSFKEIENRPKEYYILYLRRILPAEYILDVGCGLGQFLELCKEYNIRAIGIDSSIRAVETCKDKGLDVFLLDLNRPLPLAKNTFDAIFCNQVIEHIEFNRQIPLFKEFVRILKVGGKAFIYSPCKYNKPEAKKEGHIACLTPSVLIKKLFIAGEGQVKIDLSLNYPKPIIRPYRLLKLFFGLSKSQYFPLKLGDSKILDFLSASAHAVMLKVK